LHLLTHSLPCLFCCLLLTAHSLLEFSASKETTPLRSGLNIAERFSSRPPTLFTNAQEGGIRWVERIIFERRGDMELKMELIEIPEGCNVIFGQSHFIKTVEDLYEIMVSAVPGAKFGIGFCEASGHCLVRGEGNDEALKDLALKTAYRIGAGHTFIIFIKDAFPINMLNAVKMCQEVCNLFCATANPVQVVLAQSEQGRGVLGVIDGSSPKGMEKEDGVAWRKDLLRKFNYKL